MGENKTFKFTSRIKRIILFQMIRIILLVSIILEFQTKRWDILLVNLLVLSLTFSPYVMEKILAILLPMNFCIPYLSSLVLAVFLEKLFAGIVLQIFLGMVLGMIGFILLFLLYSNSRIKTSYIFIAFFSFCFSVSLGTMWEVFRYFLAVAFSLEIGSFNINNTVWGLVLDLGCGTGIFSVGASLTGAKKVIAVDIDKNAISIAKNYAQENKLDIEFLVQNIDDVKIKCDTIIMNPPFGAQKSNEKADRKFIEKAFEISSVIYSLHLSKTILFITKMVKALKGEISYSKDYIFPIKHTYDFHEKNVVNYDVTLLRILTKF